jgi:hypothetical protein
LDSEESSRMMAPAYCSTSGLTAVHSLSQKYPAN